ncbi:zinc ribbon domain-containing protein [Arthrobacter echini]|uniref:Zinc ribbon domain-containing protein n=1 Tax=Arthrobacter echini TaxID=1529066 RepID=A0A5D0XV56_9MICC|nr:zinc ribbon domain-containing protein [Arthrobacter echini]TYD00430.1 zinc ribbon domain-containing protein [Arthrobacter echini]
MPLYDFRCSAGHGTEASFAMADRPDHVACPVCGETSRRRIPSPRLSIAGSSAFGLLESTQRSAHEPEVVASTNPGKRSPTPTTSNPLHRKLPRP